METLTDLFILIFLITLNETAIDEMKEAEICLNKLEKGMNQSMNEICPEKKIFKHCTSFFDKKCGYDFANKTCDDSRHRIRCLTKHAHKYCNETELTGLRTIARYQYGNHFISRNIWQRCNEAEKTAQKTMVFVWLVQGAMFIATITTYAMPCILLVFWLFQRDRHDKEDYSQYYPRKWQTTEEPEEQP